MSLMDLVFKNILNHFLPRVGTLTEEQIKQTTSIYIEEVPRGVIQVYPEVCYTHKVQKSFDSLESAREKYTFRSEQRIRPHIASKHPEPDV